MTAQLGQRERRCWLCKAREMKTYFDYSPLYEREGNWTQSTFAKTSETVIRDRKKKWSIGTLIGTLRSDDGDGNEDVKKAIRLISKTTILHLHHAILYISLPSLHDYDVKVTFHRESTQATTKFLLYF